MWDGGSPSQPGRRGGEIIQAMSGSPFFYSYGPLASV